MNDKDSNINEDLLKSLSNEASRPRHEFKVDLESRIDSELASESNILSKIMKSILNRRGVLLGGLALVLILSLGALVVFTSSNAPESQNTDKVAEEPTYNEIVAKVKAAGPDLNTNKIGQDDTQIVKLGSANYFSIVMGTEVGNKLSTCYSEDANPYGMATYKDIIFKYYKGDDDYALRIELRNTSDQIDYLIIQDNEYLYSYTKDLPYAIKSKSNSDGSENDVLVNSLSNFNIEEILPLDGVVDSVVTIDGREYYKIVSDGIKGMCLKDSTIEVTQVTYITKDTYKLAIVEEYLGGQADTNLVVRSTYDYEISSITPSEIPDIFSVPKGIEVKTLEELTSGFTITPAPTN